MSRIFIDGFEHGQADLWTNYGATVISSSGKDMDGDYCIEMDTHTDYITRALPSNSLYYIALLYRPTNAIFSNSIFSFLDGATNLFTLVRQTTGSNFLEARRGNRAGAVIATGSTSLSLDTTYLIEVYYKPHDTAGIIQVKVNSVLDIDFSEGDTTAGGTTINAVKVGGIDNYGQGIFDNIIIDDSEFPGTTNIQGVVVNGAGNKTNWAPSSGSNWDCVNEIPANDADYVAINANEEIDLYTLADLSGTIESVKCVQLQSRTKKDGAPTPQNLALALRTANTDYFSSDKAVPSDWESLCHLWATNPNTSQAWTEGGVNGLEIGIKSRA